MMADPLQGHTMLARIIEVKGSPAQVAQLTKQNQYGESAFQGYRYYWPDGTYADEVEDGAGGYLLSGTALKDLEPTQAKAAQPIYHEGPDGQLYQIDPTTNQATPVQGMGATRAGTPTVREFPDGSLRQWDGTQWTKIADAPAAGSDPMVREVGGSLYERQPDGTWKVAVQAQSGRETVSYGGKVYERQADGSYKLVLDIPPVAPYRSAMDLQRQQYEIERLRQQTIPPASLLYEQQAQTIAALQAKIASGEITPQEADQYIQAIQANTQAALRGTTPYQEEQARRTQRQHEQNLGWDIINQGAQRSTNLASSLTSSAGNIAQNAMMPIGKTSLGVDPLALAQAYNQQQMPAGISDFARQLLMGTQGAGGMPGLGAGAAQPLTIEQVLAKYPNARRVG